MKKISIFFSLMLTPLISKAASLQYIPSTSTFFNYTENIASGTIRNFTFWQINSTGTWLLNGSTLTFNNAIFNGTKTDNSTTTYTGFNNYNGSATFNGTNNFVGTTTVSGVFNLTSTTTLTPGITFNSWTTFNASSTVNGSTITNSASSIQGTLFDSSTRTYQNAQVKGTETDLSTRTYQGGEFSGTRNDNSTTTLILAGINGTYLDASSGSITGNIFLSSASIAALMTGSLVSTGAWTLNGVTGTILLNSSTSIKGTTTNDNAAVSYIGEFISSATSRAGPSVILSSNTAKNVAAITLTAGNWELHGYGCFGVNGSGAMDYMEASISQTANTIAAATTGGNPVNGEIWVPEQMESNNANHDYCIPMQSYAKISGTTTFNLVVRMQTVTGTPVGYGQIWAIRYR